MIHQSKPLPNGALTTTCIHLRCDVHRMFAGNTEWHMPWMPRVVPIVKRIANPAQARTAFTPFIPAPHPGEGSGTWNAIQSGRPYLGRTCSLAEITVEPLKISDKIPKRQRHWRPDVYAFLLRDTADKWLDMRHSRPAPSGILPRPDLRRPLEAWSAI
jgi:hypothetical protein